MSQETRTERKIREDGERDAKQSPFGFFMLGQSYIQSANVLADSRDDTQSAFKPRFDHPIRHMYAHGWELCLKACLLEQGHKPSHLRKEYGHQLFKVWEHVERDRFPTLRLAEDIERLERVLRVMDQYHQEKLYAYPVEDWQTVVTFRHLREMSERLLISPLDARAIFSPKRSLSKPRLR